MNRRDFVETSLAGSAAALVSSTGLGRPNDPTVADENDESITEFTLKGNINHSVCQWCYRDMPLPELAANAARIGLKSVELLGKEDWQVVTDAGLICAMAYPEQPEGKNRLTDGFNQTVNHEWLIPTFQEGIRDAAAAGFPNMICFSGNRRGINDFEGLRNCADGLRQITPIAEEYGVTVCMELLNSRVNHPDYQCDHTEWGLTLVDMVGSDRFKLLYDIYHMQIMEGDVIRTIKAHSDYIAHYHTGGNPGRHEIDETQELNYRAIMEAILETGFTGFVAQEFIPVHDPMTSLEQCVKICDV